MSVCTTLCWFVPFSTCATIAFTQRYYSSSKFHDCVNKYNKWSKDDQYRIIIKNHIKNLYIWKQVTQWPINIFLHYVSIKCYLCIIILLLIVILSTMPTMILECKVMFHICVHTYMYMYLHFFILLLWSIISVLY